MTERRNELEPARRVRLMPTLLSLIAFNRTWNPMPRTLRRESLGGVFACSRCSKPGVHGHVGYGEER